MAKRLRHTSRVMSLIPAGSMGVMMDPTKIKDHLASLPLQERIKMIALLNCYYSRPQMIELFGVTKGQLNWATKKHRDIIEAVTIGRNTVIADMTERRVIEILQKMNVDKIPDDKKSQAVKYLMDSADIAHSQVAPKQEEKEETTMELIWRIRKKMASTSKEKDDDDEQNDPVQEAIDITGEVKNEENSKI